MPGNHYTDGHLERGTADDADDVFQETVLAFLQNVWTEKYQIQPGTKVTTYIYSIASNLWLKESTKRAARYRRNDEYSRDQPEIEHSVEDELANENEIQFASALFRRLGETCQGILKAFYLHHHTMEEIAEQFGLGNADNAKMKKYRCVQAFRKLLLTL
ncbi:sigma-70 family RNA polymerase sigma factor [Spirosoma sp. HMF3257]|uniref:Sigma-70 family RNA polymerase sigma factor n=1 Tax=Spirosoma telluris TaxID=2183553 RepID=A0A327NQ00_9BACT|nr:sigma-70 family RNA polymerase sigma factor [Spirosoma telluris]RAI76086.1 sigma-70 family RNA polymerase sigma factor [Spirosoma telluris]